MNFSLFCKDFLLCFRGGEAVFSLGKVCEGEEEPFSRTFVNYSQGDFVLKYYQYLFFAASFLGSEISAIDGVNSKQQERNHVPRFPLSRIYKNNRQNKRNLFFV